MSKGSKEGKAVADLDRRFFLKAMGIAATCPLWTACEFVDLYDAEVVETVEFDLSEEDMEALAEVGGMACLDAGALGILLIRKTEDRIVATEKICPHQQLNMGPCENNPGVAVWNPEREELTCRWHNSVFNLEGEVVSGPSPRGLKLFPVEFDPQTGRGVVRVTAE